MAGPCPAPPGAQSWAELMGAALEEAKKAGEQGDVPVGAIIVDPHGKTLARAGNQVERERDPCAHAEIIAIRQACEILGNNRLADCSLIVTLEPCMMCTGAVLQSQVSCVVYGAANPCGGSLLSCQEIFMQPSLPRSFWWMGGIRAQESADLLRKFFAERRGDVEEEHAGTANA